MHPRQAGVAVLDRAGIGALRGQAVFDRNADAVELLAPPVESGVVACVRPEDQTSAVHPVDARPCRGGRAHRPVHAHHYVLRARNRVIGVLHLPRELRRRHLPEDGPDHRQAVRGERRPEIDRELREELGRRGVEKRFDIEIVRHLVSLAAVHRVTQTRGSSRSPSRPAGQPARVRGSYRTGARKQNCVHGERRKVPVAIQNTPSRDAALVRLRPCTTSSWRRRTQSTGRCDASSGQDQPRIAPPQEPSRLAARRDLRPTCQGPPQPARPHHVRTR